jgi:hypothetical protein
MIHVLLWMAKHRRQHAEKQRAQALLGALLQGRHEQDFLIQAVLTQPPLGLCDMGRDHAGACTCYRRYQEAPQVFQGAKHERVVQKLLMLLGEAEEHECDTLFGLLSNLLVRLARGLCDFVAAQEPASYADLQQVVLRGHKRRLRVDPHFKEEALNKVCRRSGWSLAEALVNTVMEGEYPQRWVHSYLLQYMEACHRCFRDARIFSMGPDASRVGNPAEECIAYLIFARDCGFGAWGPLQVPSPQSCWGGEQGGETTPGRFVFVFSLPRVLGLSPGAFLACATLLLKLLEGRSAWQGQGATRWAALFPGTGVGGHVWRRRRGRAEKRRFLTGKPGSGQARTAPHFPANFARFLVILQSFFGQKQVILQSKTRARAHVGGARSRIHSLRVLGHLFRKKGIGRARASQTLHGSSARDHFGDLTRKRPLPCLATAGDAGSWGHLPAEPAGGRRRGRGQQSAAEQAGQDLGGRGQ